MTKQLTTRNATITTAAVEVKTLTISGKQVTLAVFRQLREEPLIADDGTLNGVPWGAVNYHPDRCGDSRRAHWHIVWQRGEELLRSRVAQVPGFDPYGDLRQAQALFDTPAADRLLTSQVLEWLDGRRDESPLRKRQYSINHDDEVTFRTDFEFTAHGCASTAAVDAANKRQAHDDAQQQLAKAREEENDPKAYSSPEWLARQVSHREDTARAAAAALQEARALLAAEISTWGMSHEEIRESFLRAVRAEADRRQRHRAVRAALAALPQLFIAV